jgi:hypothetical protein
VVTSPLVIPAELEDFPGAPFPAAVVMGASESVRSDAGWHIAPVVTETVTVDGSGMSPFLLLPTLKLGQVGSVRVLSDDGFLPADGWRVAGSGMLYRAHGWPYGIAGVEVTMTHGYDQVPYDLLPILAARCQRAMADTSVTQRSETVLSRTLSESYNAGHLVGDSSDGLSRYKLRRVA